MADRCNLATTWSEKEKKEMEKVLERGGGGRWGEKGKNVEGAGLHGHPHANRQDPKEDLVRHL